MASDGGKGSAPRPFSVGQDSFADNWERTFGKKNKTTVEMPGTLGGATVVFPNESDTKTTRYNEETQEALRYEK